MIKLLRQNWTFFLIVLVIFSFGISLTNGSLSIFTDPTNLSADIFLNIRLPRTIAAFVTGGLLALAGVLMQVLLQNPLADPYVLGTSSGAAFFSLLFLFFGLPIDYLILASWAGSLFSVGIVVLLSKKHGWESDRLLLVGIAVATLFGAANTVILMLSPNDRLHSMLFWLAGDLNGVSMPTLGVIFLLIGILVCMMLAPALNVLNRGDIAAKALGLHTRFLNFSLYLLTALLTSVAVTIAGSIGFVGLIIPHIARRIVQHDHKQLIPVAMICGGSLVTIADFVARTAFAPQQLPIGIVMAFIGVPIFISLVIQCKR